MATTDDPSAHDADHHSDGDLTDLLSELRVLLPGAQTLTAFLIILPFNSAFSEIRDHEKIVYVVTFLCSLLSLLLFAAPAVHHRLDRPLIDRKAFKDWATGFIIAGLIPLSAALILATELVMSQVYPGNVIPWATSGVVGIIVTTLWWIAPRMRTATR